MDTPIFNDLLLKSDVKRNVEQQYDPTKAIELFAPSIVTKRDPVIDAVVNFFDDVLEFLENPFRTLFGSSEGRHNA